jgi:hypothetical protein
MLSFTFALMVCISKILQKLAEDSLSVIDILLSTAYHLRVLSHNPMSKRKLTEKRVQTIKQQSRDQLLGVLENWLDLIADDRVMALHYRNAVEARIVKWMTEHKRPRADAIQALTSVIPEIDEILSVDVGAFSLPADCPAAEYLMVAQSIFEALADSLLPDEAIEEWRSDQVHFYETLFAVLKCAGPDRIRRCLQCNRIFYAKRGNKRMCSAACGNVRRVLKSQKKHKEKSAEYAAAENTRKGKIATKGAKYKRDYRNSHGVRVKARKRGTK